MSTLRFSDGWTVDTAGPYRMIEGPDGWYVIGRGLLCPVDDEAEGAALIETLNEKAKDGE